MKEKVKEFWEEHKGEALKMLYFGLGLGIGYLSGKTILTYRLEAGLYQRIAAKPELEGLLKEATEIVLNKKR